MTEQDLKPYLDKILQNKFYLANKFRNNIISKFCGQKLFFIKICEGLKHLVQSLGFNYWMLNRFQSPEIRNYFELADTSKMNNKEYKAFISFKEKLSEIERCNILSIEDSRSSFEHFLGIYSMCCMNEAEARKFTSSDCPNIETFLESIGVGDVKMSTEKIPVNPIKHLVNIASHLLQVIKNNK